VQQQPLMHAGTAAGQQQLMQQQQPLQQLLPQPQPQQQPQQQAPEPLAVLPEGWARSREPCPK
jgi:hypothetical protein